ncbi:MAG TPA: PIN domain-containing protein [Egibacteraceae bacterium]|jgi:predicted nucleic acid-binding protein|nr:PIN domain-containing protein [Egibacteraceae bacterium]
MRVDGSFAFVDTNILVYAHDSSAGRKRAVARELITSLWEHRSGRISVQVLQELFVVLTTKVATPLDARDAGAVIADLASWSVYVPDAGNVLDAIDLHDRAQVSFWDAMIVHCAVKAGCAVLYSEDLDDGVTYDGVRVVNPFA